MRSIKKNAMITRSLQSDSSKVNDWCTEGHRLMRIKQYRKAANAFSKAIEGDTTQAPAYFFRGVCHYHTGNYQLANDDMDAATILGYLDAQLWSKFETKDTEKKDH